MESDPLELWPSHTRSINLVQPAASGGRRWLRLTGRRQFAWKSVALLATTLAFIPVLVWRDAMAGLLYTILLVGVHVAGLAVLVLKTRRTDIAPTPGGLAWRIGTFAVLFAVLALAAAGLSHPATRPTFWASLGTVWVLHTGALLVLHVRTPGESLRCPVGPLPV